MNLKKIWRNFLDKPWSHRIFWITVLVILPSLYLFLGMSLVSRPSLVLYNSRGPGFETEASIFLKSQGIYCVDAPKVYILTKNTRRIFYWPYVFAFRLLVNVRYPGQIHQSYPRVEDNAIVMQEEEASDRWVFAHEVGHLAHLCVDPEGFERQTQTQREKFADDFQAAIQSKFQSVKNPFN